MLPRVRNSLQQSLDYHQRVSEYHGQLDKGGREAEPQVQSEERSGFTHDEEESLDQRPPRDMPEEKKPESVDAYLCRLHAEVAKQLRDLLNSVPMTPAILQARDDRTIVRGQPGRQRNTFRTNATV